MNSRRHILKALASAIGTVPFVKKLSGTLSPSPEVVLSSLIRKGNLTYMRVYADTPITAGHFVFWTDRESYRVTDKCVVDIEEFAGWSREGCASYGPCWILVRGDGIAAAHRLFYS